MKQTFRKTFIFLVAVFTLMGGLLSTRPASADVIDRFDPAFQAFIDLPGVGDQSLPDTINIKSQAAIKQKAQPIVTGSCPVNGVADFEQSVLELINQERQKAGVPLLTLNENLTTSARQHSAEMPCLGFFSHVGSGNSTPFDRIKGSGYLYSAAGEIIFAGEGAFFTPEQALKAWLNSSSHRATLLRDHYSEVGIGIVYDPESQYGGYFTVDFASPAP